MKKSSQNRTGDASVVVIPERVSVAMARIAYRDTFRLLLGFVEEQAGKRPAVPSWRPAQPSR